MEDGNGAAGKKRVTESTGFAQILALESRAGDMPTDRAREACWGRKKSFMRLNPGISFDFWIKRRWTGRNTPISHNQICHAERAVDAADAMRMFRLLSGKILFVSENHGVVESRNGVVEVVRAAPWDYFKTNKGAAKRKYKPDF